jgi:hypothetical protein
MNRRLFVFAGSGDSTLYWIFVSHRYDSGQCQQLKGTSFGLTIALLADWCGPKAGMKSWQLINSAALGPDALKVAGQAFDEAWAQIATFFGNDRVMIEGRRLALAVAILSVASNESRNVGALKRAGIQAMARQYELQRPYAPKN